LAETAATLVKVCREPGLGLETISHPKEQPGVAVRVGIGVAGVVVEEGVEGGLTVPVMVGVLDGVRILVAVQVGVTVSVAVGEQGLV